MTIARPQNVISAALLLVATGCMSGVDAGHFKGAEEALTTRSIATPTFAAGAITQNSSRDVAFDYVRVLGRRTRSKSVALTFSLAAGETAHLSASGVMVNGQPSNIDTVLMLFRADRRGAPTGASVADNDDYNGNVSSYFSYRAEAAGNFVAIVQRFDRRSTGRIRVSLSVEAAQRACGSRGLGPCRDNEYCAFPAGANCGRSDAPGVCTVRPQVCAQVYMPVCGCDGQTYGNACMAGGAGVSVETNGACPARCEAQDAHGEGQCRRVAFGWAWNGERCETISGCQCVGNDCNALYTEESTCRDAHTSCFSSCLATAAWGEGQCDQVLGYKWDGNSCVGVSGCSCNGRACGELTTQANCEAAHYYCAPDCRTTGCGAGSSCQVCWVGYACVPDGAVC